MESSPRENNCVVCFRNISIYAVGDCDHYDRVCYICSTRLRVLCNKYECAICRKDIPKVIFSKHRQPFGALSKIHYPMDHKYRIAFADPDVREDYETLLEHPCLVCKEKHVFRSFGHLKDHVRKEHELFFCELCVDNLKLFTNERRCYTRKELGTHRRVGDPEDTSHRGHPRCQFCEERYLDKDELFRHLRREHFYCHFCDAEGIYQFYGEYKYLQNHFREEHFLCEEGECKDEQFTGVFRTEIDLKAHKATQHCKNMNKQQAKQARTLELEFTIRPSIHQQKQDYKPAARRGREGPGREPRNTKENDYDGDPQGMDVSFPVYAPDTNCQKQFPQLGNKQDGQQSASTSSAKPFRKNLNTNSTEDFPTLSGAPPQPKSNNVTSTRLTVSSSQPTMPASSVLFKINNKDKGGGTGNISIKVSSKQKNSNVFAGEDFPTLTTQSKKVFPQASASLPIAKPSNMVKPNNVVKPPPNKVASKPDQECNGWKSNKPSGEAFEDDFPQLIGKTNNKPSKSLSSLTIPIGGSSWSKQKESKDAAIPQTEAPFTIIKGKSTKRVDKNGPRDQDPKQKDNNPKKDTNKKGVSPKKQETEKSNSSTNEKKESKLNINVSAFIPPDHTQAISETTNSEKTANTMNSNVSSYIPPDTAYTKPVQPHKAHINDDMDFPPLITDFHKPSAPPGFFSKALTNSNVPPPGFSPNAQNSLNLGVKTGPALTLSTVAKQLTNYSPPSPTLEPANISSITKLIRALYIEPDSFEERNRSLIQKIRDVLDGDESAFSDFKTLSGQFRQSLVPAIDYYDRCIGIFGKEKFLKVLPELLVLLPDIGKEQELLNIYNQMFKKENQSSGAVPKSSVINSQNTLQVLVCATCQQVLVAKDFQKHMLYHNEEALFPPLGGGNHSTTTNISWVKK